MAVRPGSGWEGAAARRHGGWVLGALAIVVAVGALVGPGELDGSGPSVLEVQPPVISAGSPVAGHAAGEWVELPDPPAAWTHPPRMVWTGRELLVHGATARGSGLFAYDPAGRSWRVEERGPAPARHDAALVWMPARGTDPSAGGRLPAPDASPGHGELLVWDGASASPAAARREGLATAYDPRTRRWRTITGSPLSPGTATAPVWIGDRVLFAGGAVAGGFAVDAATYDPAGDEWEAAPDLPRAAPIAAATWMGTRAVVVLQDTGGVFGWHPGAAAWQEMPALPAPPGRGSVAAATGGRLVIWPGRSSGPDADRLLTLDGAVRPWRPAPAAPLLSPAPPQVVPAGRDVYVIGGGDSGRDAALYDLESQAWRLMPALPASVGEPTSAVWAGRELIVAGDGVASWRPAAWIPPLDVAVEAVAHFSDDTTLTSVVVDRLVAGKRDDLPLAAGGPPQRLAAVDGHLVFFGGSRTYALRADDSEPLTVGDASFFLPAGSDAVWLLHARSGPRWTATKVTAEGTELREEQVLDGVSWPLAGLADTLVGLGTAGDGWILREPGEHAAGGRSRPGQVIASGAETVAVCEVAGNDAAACTAVRLSGAGGAGDRSVAAPEGWVLRYQAGAFGPDDRWLALRAETVLGDAGVVVVDLADGSATGTPTPLPAVAITALAWHPTRPWLFVAGSRQLLAIRGGDAQAYAIDVEVPALFQGFAVTTAP